MPFITWSINSGGVFSFLLRRGLARSLCPPSLVDTCMIPQLAFFVNPFFEKSLIFFLWLLGLAFGLVSLATVYMIPQRNKENNNNLNTVWLQFGYNIFSTLVGGVLTSYRLCPSEADNRLCMYTRDGFSGTKNYKKLQMVFSDKLSHQKFFSIQITINIFSIQITIKKIKHLFRCFIFRIFYFFFFS